MSAVLEKLKSAEAADRQAAQVAYQRLVAAAVDDKSVDEAVAAETLKAAGKSVADLEGDVQFENEIRALKAEIKAGQDAAAALQQTREALAQVKSDCGEELERAALKFERVKQESAEKVRVADGAFRRCASTAQRGEQAQRELNRKLGRVALIEGH